MAVPNDKPKHPFTAGLPAAAVRAESKKYQCVGKLTVDRKVSYGASKPR